MPRLKLGSVQEQLLDAVQLNWYDLMEKFEHIAYEGKEFCIEWYCTERGKSQAYQYYQSSTQAGKIKMLKLFKLLGDMGSIKDNTKFRYEGNGIYAFKPQPDRFLCFFFKGKKIIVTNAFRKKQQKLPKLEKMKAQICQKDFFQRIEQDEYYEQQTQVNF